MVYVVFWILYILMLIGIVYLIDVFLLVVWELLCIVVLLLFRGINFYGCRENYSFKDYVNLWLMI